VLRQADHFVPIPREASLAIESSAATLTERYLSMKPQSDEALEVLRGVWDSQGQSRADLDASCGRTKVCKRMVEVGFEAMAGADGDLRAAWRAQLQREGKLRSEAGSLRDLVLGAQEAPSVPAP
jgi:hypothetical protein